MGKLIIKKKNLGNYRTCGLYAEHKLYRENALYNVGSIFLGEEWQYSIMIASGFLISQSTFDNSLHIVL
jgi:hypothetical protein